MVRRTRATTLLELLVVMAVWSFIMAAVLGFYVYGTKISRNQDEHSKKLRALQQVADKFNTVLRNSQIREVIQFPPAVLFQRVDDTFPLLPDCLLPNWNSQTEFIGIAPDNKKSGPASDPTTCLSNAVYLGRYGTPGTKVMELPSGMIGEFRVYGRVLLLSFNNPKSETQPILNLLQSQPKPLEPLNHYFQFRGLREGVRFRKYQ